MNSNFELFKITVWFEGWKIGRIEQGEELEKWEERNDLVFSYMCLVRMIEKLRDGKLICLIEKKNDKMKIKVGINLQLYPY